MAGVFKFHFSGHVGILLMCLKTVSNIKLSFSHL